MSYSNYFLTDFLPVFHEILQSKKLSMEHLVLEIIDEDSENQSMFEPADVLDVLNQIGQELNFLTIYTERAGYFSSFVQKMYEENGLIVNLIPKKKLQSQKEMKTENFNLLATENNRKKCRQTLVLDFEWDGPCYVSRMTMGKIYIPIHKKPWKIGENLDIMVPFGYNTVIVKNKQNLKRKPIRDRFEEAFYSKE